MKKRLFSLIAVLFIWVIFEASAYAEKLLYAAPAEGGMVLYLSPGEDGIEIVHIPACAKMSLIETEGTWGLVNFQNKYGWINLSFTRDTYDDAAEATGIECIKNVQIKSKEQNVVLYNLPSEDEASGSEEKYSVPGGMIVKIIRETADGWGLVSISNEYAWVKMENTKPYKSPAEQSVSQYEIYYVYVLTKGEGILKMHTNPGSGNVLALIPDCAKLTVRETKENFAHVSYEGISGWIDLNCTTTSFYYARTNAGTVVNKEFVTVASEDGGKIPIFTIPYEEETGGNDEIGSIDGDIRVFVQRVTHNGWCFINHNGVLGWIPPQSAVEVPPEEKEEIVLIEKPGEKYTATEKGKGVLLYADFDGKSAGVTLPEYIKVRTLAEKDAMVYIYSDYASGWTESGMLCDSYEEALNTGVLSELPVYHTLSKCTMMKLPGQEDFYENSKVCDIEKNTVLKVKKFVSAQKDKWVLVETDGKSGFVKLVELKKGYPLKRNLYFIYITSGMAFLILVCVLTVHFIRKKKKINKISKNS